MRWIVKNIGSRIIMTGLTVLVVTGCSETKPFASQFESNWKDADPKALSEAEPEPSAKIMPKTHFAAGKMFEAQGALGRAIVQYQKTLEMDPEHLGALNRLGMVYARIGKPAEAEATLKRAVRLAPRSAQVRNNLGFSYLLAERWSDAEAEFQNALSIMPEFERARINLGIAYCRQQHFDEAILAFRQVIPEADTFYNLGLMLRSEERYQDAGRAFKRAIQMNPSFLAAKQQLAQIGPRLRRLDDNEIAMSDSQWQSLVHAQPAPVNDLERVLQGYAETPEPSYESRQYDSQPQMAEPSPAQTASSNLSNFNRPAPSQAQPQSPSQPRRQTMQPIVRNRDHKSPGSQMHRRSTPSIDSQQPMMVGDSSRQNQRKPAQESTTHSVAAQPIADSSQLSGEPRNEVQTRSSHNESHSTITDMQLMTPTTHAASAAASKTPEEQPQPERRQEQSKSVAKQTPAQPQPVANSMQPIDEQRSVPAEVRNYQENRRSATLAKVNKANDAPVQTMTPTTVTPSPTRTSQNRNVATNDAKPRKNANTMQPAHSRQMATTKPTTRSSSSASASTGNASSPPMDIVSDMTPITQPRAKARTASHPTTQLESNRQTSQPSSTVPAQKFQDRPVKTNNGASDGSMTAMEPMTPMQANKGDRKTTAAKSKAKTNKKQDKANKQDAKSNDDATEMEPMDTIED